MYLKFLFIVVPFIMSNALIFNQNKPKTNFKFVGDTKPLGFFDPFGLCKNYEENKIKFVRDAELQHGRIAMVSSLILPIIDLNTKELGINYFNQMPMADRSIIGFYIMFIEYRRLVSNFEKSNKKINLKNEPGKYFEMNSNKEMMNKELNNGRLAMIGVVGYIIQELVTGKKIL